MTTTHEKKNTAPQPQEKDGTDFSTRVLESIEERGTTVKPKWQFQMREGLLWSLITISILIGSLAVAIIVSNISDSDLPLYMRSGQNPFVAVGRLLPYFWIGLLVLIAGAIEWHVKHTKKGYKLRTSVVLGAVVITSTAAGVGLAQINIGRQLDYALEREVPLYAEFITPHHRQWENPDNGILAGNVAAVTDDYVILQTLRGDDWIVVLLEDDYEQVEENRVLRAIGERTTDAYEQEWFAAISDATEYTVTTEYVFTAVEWKQRPEDAPFGRKKGKQPKELHPMKQLELSPAQ